MAEKRDFFKEQSLQGEFILIRPAISSAALVSGEIDYDSLPENGLRVTIEEAKRVGKVDREVAFNEVADLSLLREAQKELGIAVKWIVRRKRRS